MHFWDKIQSDLLRAGDKMWLVGLVILTVGSVQARVRLDPLVETPAGLIRGLKDDDGQYSMFLGIPYAQVPADNPFGTSIPQPKFDEVFNAYDDSAVCPQVEEFENTIVGTLDCLHLNIYVPNEASSRNKLPVLVWIYGGGFSIGFANRYLYGPKFLIRHNVLLVTLNYRVGPYGFFCLDTPEVPGNQGLKDQLLALRWIKENIGSFGGDVNKITVMGESAGSASVEYHLISKQEKLFNQAILQSGTILIPGLIEESDATVPLRIAEHLGLQTDDLAEALSFLSSTDTRLVIAATNELSIPARPCIEKEFENVLNIITDYPSNLDIPKARSTNILAGFNSRELMTTYVTQSDEYFKGLNVFQDSLKKVFNYDDDFKEMEDIVRHFYIGDEEISKQLKWELSDFQSDITFNFPIQLSLKNYLEKGAQNIYQYMFSYSGGRNFVKKRLNITEEGAAHADEIGYLFDISYDKATPSAEDQLVIDRMTKLWTNFVKYGDPTPDITELLPVKWTPLTQDVYTYLNIDANLTISRRPFHNRMAFWNLFYEANQDKLKWNQAN